MSAAYITARVRAGARAERIERKESGRFEIAVREPAEGNAANRRALSLLARELGVPVSRLRIASGHRKPAKRIELRGGGS